MGERTSMLKKSTPHAKDWPLLCAS